MIIMIKNFYLLILNVLFSHVNNNKILILITLISLYYFRNIFALNAYM